jgi:hypothetical protein
MKYVIWKLNLPQNFLLSIYQLNHGPRLASLKTFNLISRPTAGCGLLADMSERHGYNSSYWRIGARSYE